MHALSKVKMIYFEIRGFAYIAPVKNMAERASFRRSGICRFQTAGIGSITRYRSLTRLITPNAICKGGLIF